MSDTSPGALLRRWREGAGKTQTECAAAVHVKQSTWSEWEAGTRVPRTTHAFLIEDLTGGQVPARAFAKPEAA